MRFDIESIKGVIPAMITIFDKDEKIDELSTRRFVNFLIDKKAGGLYLTGTTGEAFLMTRSERIEVIKVVCDEVNGRIPVIAHVGDIGTKNSIEIAKASYNAGVDAISSVPPFYWNFSKEEIYNYYKDIVNSTPLPLIIYNINLAKRMDIDFIEKLSKLDNIKGIKYTLPDHYEISMLKDILGDDFMIYSGKDQMALSGLLAGADGIIGSFYNVFLEMFVDIYNAFKSNNMILANKRQKECIRLITYCTNYSFYSIIRLLLKERGIEAGYCKKPFKNFTNEEFEVIKKQLKAIKNEYKINSLDYI